MGRGKARDVFGEPESLVTIEVSGRSYEVPADISVQRALQYVSLEFDELFIDYGAFCWNNERGCCVCNYQPKQAGKVVEARICRATVFDGQVIETLPKGMRFVDEERPARPQVAARRSIAAGGHYTVASPVAPAQPAQPARSPEPRPAMGARSEGDDGGSPRGQVAPVGSDAVKRSA